MPSWNEAVAQQPTRAEMSVGASLTRSETFSARDELTEFFAEAFAKHGGGLPVTFEVILQMLPDPTRGQWIPMVGVYAQIPAHTLGKVIPMMATGPEGWAPYDIRQAEADEIARQMMERLREGRDKEVQVASEQAQQAAQNGQSAPHSGLILP